MKISKSGLFIIPGLALFLALTGCGEAESPKKETAPEKKNTEIRKTIRKKTVIQDSEEGSLKVKVNIKEQKNKKPEVKDHSHNIIITDKNDKQTDTSAVSKKEAAIRKTLRTQVPAKSLAAALTPLHEGKTIRWSPQWQQDEIRGVRLPAFALSHDKSILLLIETLGEKDGPYASRLIFYNTHTWTIAAVRHLDRTNIRSVTFSPENKLYLFSRKQDVLDTQDEILEMDVITGKITGRQPEKDVKQLVCGKDFLAVTHLENSPDATVVSCYKLNDGMNKNRIKTKNTAPEILFSEDSRNLILAGEKELEFFRLPALKKEQGTALPENFRVSALCQLRDGSLLLGPVLGSNRQALHYRNGAFVPFGENAEGVFALSGEAEYIYSVMSSKGRVVLLHRDDHTEKESFSPEEIRPYTRGNPRALFVLPHLKGLSILDDGGSFYLIYRVEKRFRKEILFSPQK